MSKEKREIEPSNQGDVDLNLTYSDTFLLFGSALRYALPRHSYIVGVVLDAVVNNAPFFSLIDLRKFAEEIHESILEDQIGANGPDKVSHQIDLDSKKIALDCIMGYIHMREDNEAAD